MKSLRWFDLRLVFALLLGTAALSIAHLELSFGANATAFLGFIFISVILAAVGSLLWGLYARRRTVLLFGGYLLLLLVLYVLVVRIVDTKRKAETFRRGDAIAAALSSFQAERDRYPDSLPELVPKYISETPNTAMSALREVPFGYRLSDSGGFVLTFPAPAWLICYRTESSPWVCDD